MNLSIVISAYNEEKKIEDCLRSASFADEIIFVDNTSSDKTVEIAKKYTSKVFIRPNNLMLNVNKNFGFTKATGDWILSLDADERISPELVKEIKSEIINHRSSIVGYWIPRKNIIFGKWIENTGWYPDYQLRLFKKSKGKFLEKHVHEMIKLEGETGYLKNHIIHYNYDGVLQFLRKLEIYIPSEAQILIGNGYKLRAQDAIHFPVKEFVSRFFSRKGYKDGLHGLVLSLLMAFYHLLVFAYIWEKNKFKEVDVDALNLSKNEFKKVKKEVKFWILNEMASNSKNLPKKLWLKLRQRLEI